MVAALTEPAAMTWIMGRIAALLSPYYEKDIPQGIRSLDAEDWAEALRDKPEWAITAAVRWWKSDANKDRRKRPLEGDIMARVRVEMDAVLAARIVLAKPAVADQPDDAPRCSPETAAERRKVAEDALRGFGARLAQ